MTSQIAVLAVILLTTATVAYSAPVSVEASSTGARLPLHPGFYVESDVPCAEAFQAAIIQFTGKEIEAGSDLCAITKIARLGKSYTVTERCQEQTDGHWHSDRGTIVIPNSRAFIAGTKTTAQRFRYCPILALPESWKNSKETVPDFPPFGGSR